MRVGSNYLGLQLEGFQASELTRQRLRQANYQQYPEQYAHMLVHALQFNKKIPSINRMEKTDKKNKNQKGMQVLEKPKKRYQGRKMMPQFQKVVSNEAIKKKTQSKPYQIHSPQQIVLKSERLHIMECLTRWKKINLMDEQHPKQEAPLYFKKKRASHRRRVKERRQLIMLNRDKLLQIFGAEILKKQTKIGRQDIRIALGIEIKVAEPEAIGEFMKMAEKNE